MSFNFGNLAIKALQLALIADQEYANVAATGTASTLLAPNNFQAMSLELAQVFAPAPTPAPEVKAPVTAVGVVTLPSASLTPVLTGNAG